MAIEKPISSGVPGALILTHPAFDRPPVVNIRRPGRKRGTTSLNAIRRQRLLAESAEREALRLMPAHDLVAQHGAGEVLVEGRPTAGAVAIAVGAALSLLDACLRQPGAVMTSPDRVRAFLALNLAELDRESFHVMFLDSQNALITFEAFGVGTLAQTAVYPRDIARRALALNAAAVILAHNHPSGNPEPSRMDEALTLTIRHALSMFDVRVLDHVVVGRLQVVSMAERGML